MWAGRLFKYTESQSSPTSKSSPCTIHHPPWPQPLSISHYSIDWWVQTMFPYQLCLCYFPKYNICLLSRSWAAHQTRKMWQKVTDLHCRQASEKTRLTQHWANISDPHRTVDSHCCGYNYTWILTFIFWIIFVLLLVKINTILEQSLVQIENIFSPITLHNNNMS